MAITNLSTQHISASYQYLAQISPSGDIYDGLGNQITSLNLANATFNSIKNADSASYVNTLNQTLILSGSLRVSGSQNFVGTKTLSGSIFITGSKFIVGDNYITGSHNVSGSITLTGPSIQNSASLGSTLISGSMEFDGSTFYRTVDSSGRTLNANHHLFYLPTSIAHTASIQTDAFSGSLNVFQMQANSLYEVQYNLFYTKTGNGAVTWNIFSVDQTMQNIHATIDASAAGGTSHYYATDALATGGSPITSAVINKVNTVNASITLPSLTNATNHKAIIKALIWSHSSLPSKLKLQITQAGTNTTIWPGSYYTIKKLPVASVGTFTLSP